MEPNFDVRFFANGRDIDEIHAAGCSLHLRRTGVARYSLWIGEPAQVEFRLWTTRRGRLNFDLLNPADSGGGPLEWNGEELIGAAAPDTRLHFESIDTKAVHLNFGGQMFNVRGFGRVRLQAPNIPEQTWGIETDEQILARLVSSTKAAPWKVRIDENGPMLLSSVPPVRLVHLLARELGVAVGVVFGAWGLSGSEFRTVALTERPANSALKLTGPAKSGVVRASGRAGPAA